MAEDFEVVDGFLAAVVVFFADFDAEDLDDDDFDLEVDELDFEVDFLAVLFFASAGFFDFEPKRPVVLPRS
ncbi:MAG: hypothetical protein R2684_01260 [Pyrinomonadaceae bacterium]